MMTTGRSGPAHASSPLRDEIRALEDMMALLIDIDEIRKDIKLKAWQAGDIELFDKTENQKLAVKKIKQIYKKTWLQLNERTNKDVY